MINLNRYKTTLSFVGWGIILAIVVLAVNGASYNCPTLIHPLYLLPLQPTWQLQVAIGVLAGLIIGGWSGYESSRAPLRRKRSIADGIIIITGLMLGVLWRVGKYNCLPFNFGWRESVTVLPFTWTFSNTGLLTFLLSYTWKLNQKPG